MRRNTTTAGGVVTKVHAPVVRSTGTTVAGEETRILELEKAEIERVCVISCTSRIIQDNWRCKRQSSSFESPGANVALGQLQSALRTSQVTSNDLTFQVTNRPVLSKP